MVERGVSNRAATDPRRGGLRTSAGLRTRDGLRTRAGLRAVGALANAVLVLAASAAAADAPARAADPAESRELRGTGMTFVGSGGDGVSGLVLHSKSAAFLPEDDLANLEQVAAVLTDAADRKSFELTCDHAKLHVDTNDFRAEGNVRGTTSDGQQYSAPWVEYDHAAGLLFTDAPVRMIDGTGSFRGDGFRYSVAERAFRLLGNVLVEQGP